MPRTPVLTACVIAAAVLVTAPGAARARERGRNVPQAQLRTEPTPRPSGRVHLVNNLREEIDVNIYRPDGSYDEAALAALDHALRDRRRGEVKAIDPRLYEILSMLQDHFEGRLIHLGSGFRIERTTSRHFQGSAADLRVDGISYRDVFEYATTLDRGGMGMGRYPRQTFVHVDFRAPGEPSYRWVDTSRAKKPKGKPGRRGRRGEKVS